MVAKTKIGIFILLSILLLSCEKYKPKAVILLNDFYFSKSLLIQSFYQHDTISIKKYEKLTTFRWNEIIRNREEVLAFLFTLELDTSSSIYGINYIDNQFSMEKIPNNLHSLYLIECIIRDDYLFNRRKYTNFSYMEYFKSDYLNFIYDTTTPPTLSHFELERKYDFHQHDSALNAAWNTYKKWYNNDYRISKKLGVSTLDSTKYRWYSCINNEGGKSFYSDIVKTEEYCKTVRTRLGDKYHLYFKIGDGWQDENGKK